MNGSNVV